MASLTIEIERRRFLRDANIGAPRESLYGYILYDIQDAEKMRQVTSDADWRSWRVCALLRFMHMVSGDWYSVVRRYLVLK